MLGTSKVDSRVHIPVDNLNIQDSLQITTTFAAALEIWEQEGVHLGEDRTEAVRVLTNYYECYLSDPDHYFCLDLSDPVFSNISSFSSLSLEKHFLHLAEINFSNCTALTTLPESLLVNLRLIDISNCQKLQISPLLIPPDLSVAGFARANLQQFIEDQWKNNAQSLFKYENNYDLLREYGLAKVDDKSNFFVFLHPSKLNNQKNSVAGAPGSLGWKLHVSVDPKSVEKAFELVGPIVAQYCMCFKVTNTKSSIQFSDRFLYGTQITIYLEDGDKPVISADDAAIMIKQIDQALLDNNIQPGIRPESDAKVIDSEFCTLRNDKCKLILTGNRYDYLGASEIGNNFNPANNPNPFERLLSADTKQFSPVELFQSTDSNATVSNEPMFVSMLNSCLREFTFFDTMDQEQREKCILQYCLGNGENNDAWFLKESYRNNPEILLAVRQAFYILLVFLDKDTDWSSTQFHEHVAAAQLSTHYPFDNPFRKMMVAQEARSKEAIGNRICKNDEPYSLIEPLKLASKKRMENLPNDELIAFVHKGHFYNSQAALAELKRHLSTQEYVDILYENASVPAVQIELAKLVRWENPKKSEEYVRSALLSEDSNYIEFDRGDDPARLLLTYQTLEELQALSKSGHSFATIVLAILHARDALENTCKALPEIHQFSDVPIDYGLAKVYLQKIQLNIRYSIGVAEINKVVEEKIKELEERTALITTLQKKDFEHSQAALKKLKTLYKSDEYTKLLHENETNLAVQLELAEYYKKEDVEKSEAYCLNVMLSEASNCLQIYPSPLRYEEILMKHQNLEQIKELSHSGNPIASFVLAMLYGPDAFTGTVFDIQNYTNGPDVPSNHDAAKDYLQKFQSTTLVPLNHRHAKQLLSKFNNL